MAKSKEENDRQNWHDHIEFVNEFFQRNEDYWPPIHKNYQNLQDLYTQIREKKEAINVETDEKRRNDISSDLKRIQDLLNYRRKRYDALLYEANKRDQEKNEIVKPEAQIALQEESKSDTQTDQQQSTEETRLPRARKLPTNQPTGLLEQVHENLSSEQTVEVEQDSSQPTGLLDQVRDNLSSNNQPQPVEQEDQQDNVHSNEESRGLARARKLPPDQPTRLLDKVRENLSTQSSDTQQDNTQTTGLLDQVRDNLSSDDHSIQQSTEKNKGLLEKVKDILSDTDEIEDEPPRVSEQETKEEIDEPPKVYPQQTEEHSGGLLDQTRQQLQAGETDSRQGLLDIVREKLIPIDSRTPEVEFEYFKNIDRFRAIFNNDDITHISLSEQLAYVLGFENQSKIEKGEIGRYGVDMKGGYSSFAVYANGLTRNVILGNSLSSLLRIVAVDSMSGGVTERIFDQPMFVPVLPRSINEIEIEIRWMNGKYVFFEYGTVMVTLVFKKVINF